jgi:hypothetical protein
MPDWISLARARRIELLETRLGKQEQDLARARLREDALRQRARTDDARLGKLEQDLARARLREDALRQRARTDDARLEKLEQDLAQARLREDALRASAISIARRTARRLLPHGVRRWFVRRGVRSRA